jgi:hypothetical protein
MIGQVDIYVVVAGGVVSMAAESGVAGHVLGIASIRVAAESDPQLFLRCGIGVRGDARRAG